MRSKVVLMWLFFVTAAHAQQLKVVAPGTVVQAGVLVAPGQEKSPAGTPVAPAQAKPSGAAEAKAAPASAPGVVTLSEVARHASAEATKAVPGQPALPDVPAITSADGSGAAIDAARTRMRAADPQSDTARSILLSRIASVDGDMWAVLWVKGQHRRVIPGARVLQYTIGEIRDDGVCLYKSGAHAKDKCPTLLTFNEGVL